MDGLISNGYNWIDSAETVADKLKKSPLFGRLPTLHKELFGEALEERS